MKPFPLLVLIRSALLVPVPLLALLLPPLRRRKKLDAKEDDVEALLEAPALARFEDDAADKDEVEEAAIPGDMPFDAPVAVGSLPEEAPSTLMRDDICRPKPLCCWSCCVRACLRPVVAAKAERPSCSADTLPTTVRAANDSTRSSLW